ncbi:3-oxoacyl-[acyl-carrier-protein] reductase [Lentibacillus sp. JNUCC-1]|uniref:SDR family oxidoreductase n=1 Tax=Lentibacillus sp. JNUCC-1 TaxID=2654513 RepID=UPI0012E7E4F4|nr:SDR family oxidoreductase [Lentibacillus sp. JNUCC-1]MUV38428.1 3-oxoacyl-[acyl-carrier-protein] reductase [Lentibacillus sp. JNUCC-1]
MKLKDKVAVITGAGSGMGEAIALLYAKEGAKVVAADLNADTAEKVADDIKAAGGEATAVTANVAKEDDVQKMIDTAVEKYGTVDILVNNAGIMDNFVPAGNVTDDLWNRILDVNLTSVMRATRKVLPIFLEKEGGVIINNTSSGGLYGSRSGAAYTASKHAVTGFTKNVAFMYAEKGIRCNAIAPGGVDTNINTSIDNPDEFGMSRVMSGANNTPRSGKPEEIATIALFLASGDSSFVNGVSIEADGGWTAY